MAAVIPVAISWIEAGQYAYNEASSGPVGTDIFLRWWRLLEARVQADAV